jgi:pyridoxine 4-dehydrogenase
MTINDSSGSGAAERTVRIGQDLEIGRIGYGAMRLGDADVWRGPQDRQAAVDLVRKAADLGVTLFDTADAYNLGASEEIVGEALAGRDDVVVVSKAGVARPGPSMAEWTPLGRPEYLKQQVELSLRRLGVEQVPVYLLHRVDPLVPLTDQVGALKEMQDAGKIGHLGLSLVTEDQIQEASTVAEITVVQNLFNLAARDDSDIVDYCESKGIVYMPFFPMAVGELAQPGGAVAAVAEEVGATSAQVALAWLLYRSPALAPIPGTGSADHLAQNMAALDLELSDEQLLQLVERQ